MATDIGVEIETLDVAVEDLLRVEVSYGRLSLVLKSVLDKLRAQTEMLREMKEDHDDLESRHQSLQDAVKSTAPDSKVYEGLRAATPKAVTPPPPRDFQTPNSGGSLKLQPGTPSRPSSGAYGSLAEEVKDLQDRVRKLEKKRPWSAGSKIRSHEISDLQDMNERRDSTGKGFDQEDFDDDDALLDDIMADHHRRLLKLEEENKAELDAMFHRFGIAGAPAGSEGAPDLSKAEKARGVEGAVSSVTLSAPVALKALKESATVHFVLDTPARDGDVRLVFDCEGLAFSPAAAVVKAGSTTSEDVTITAVGAGAGSATFVTVRALPEGGCSNDLTASPFVTSGIINKAAGVSGDSPPPSGSRKGSSLSGSSRKGSGDGRKGSGDGRKGSGDSRKSSAGSKKGAGDKAQASSKLGGPIKAIELNKLATIGDKPDTLFFHLDNVVEGAPVILTPTVPGCDIVPSQVIVPVNGRTSGSFSVRPSPTATSGATPISVDLQPIKGNTNDIQDSSFKVPGLTLEMPDERWSKADEVAEKAPNCVGAIEMSAGTMIVPQGDASDYTCFVLDVPAEGGSLTLVPTAPGVNFTPAEIIVHKGHYSSEPFVMKASRFAPPGSLTVVCKLAPKGPESTNTNTFASQSYDVVGLTICDDTSKLPSYLAIGAGPGQEDSGGRHGGFSDRKRALVDGHENRIKDLERKLRATLEKLRASAEAQTLAPRLQALEDAVLKKDLPKDKELQEHFEGKLQRTVSNMHELETGRKDHQRLIDALRDALEVQRKFCDDLKHGVEILGEKVDATTETCNGLEERLGKEEIASKALDTKVASLSAKSEASRRGSVKHTLTDADVSKQISDLNLFMKDLRDMLKHIEGSKANIDDLNRLATKINNMDDILKLLSSKVDGQTKSTIARLSRPASAASGEGKAGGPLTTQEMSDEMADLRLLVGTHASMIDNLFADKASRDTMVRQGQDIQDLQNILKGMPAGALSGGSFSFAGGGSGSVSGAAGAEGLDAVMAIIKDHERRLKALDGGVKKADVENTFAELNILVENLQLNKADSGAVAGKAEREYVENALEKLRREVEQVMNNTNSGLIDTLDKSLNILRDMIDGKANTADMLKLRDALMMDQKKDDGPEGLAGYKTYRCLSCNRKMDGMRPRPMGMNFNSFMSHLPNPRVKQYSKGGLQSVGLLPNSSQATAKAITAGAGAAQDDYGLPPLPAPEYGQAPPHSAPALESGSL